MKKNKGFTLIELITTITILGLVMILAIPIFNSVSGRTLIKTYQNKVKYIELAGGNFANNLENEIKSTDGIVCVDIETLIKEGYLISDEKNRLLLSNPNQTATSNSEGEVGKYMSGVLEMFYQNEDVMIRYTTNSSTCSTMVEIPDEEDLRYIVDLVPPTGTFSINQGDFTNSRDLTLTLSPNDDAFYFCFSNSISGCTVYHKLSDYNLSNVSYRLPDSYDGTHRIYLWYRDKHFNTMETPATDSIIYDATRPTGSILINGGNTYTNTSVATLTLIANDATSRLEAMCVSNSNTCTNWESFSPTNNLNISKTWTLESIQGTRRVSVWYRDRSKNISIQYFDDIILDTVNPTNGTISINNNDTYTTSRNVSLKLSSTDATSGLGFMCISISPSCVSWQPYSTDSIITLAVTQGNQNVHVKYMDNAGNTSTQISDVIYLDTIAPICTNRGDSTIWTASDRTIYYGCRDDQSECNIASSSEKNRVFSITTKQATINSYTINDNAGNSTVCPARTANVYVDKDDPICANSGDSTVWTSSDRTIYYECRDSDSGCNPSYSGGLRTFNTTTTQATIAAYEIRDGAGNSRTCPARTANVYVDKEGPTCTNSGDSTNWTQANRTIYYGCDPGGGSACNPSYSGGSRTFNTTTTQATIAAYEIRDAAGNSRTCPARTANVYVDKDAPTCTNSGDSTNWTQADRTIYYGCDAGSGSACNASYSGGSRLFNVTTTQATIVAYEIRDVAGNSRTCLARTADVYVDKSAPTCSISFTACGATGTGTCADGESGIKTGASSSITAGDTMSHSCENNVGQTSSCSISKTYDSCCSGSNTCVGGYVYGKWGNKTCSITVELTPTKVYAERTGGTVYYECREEDCRGYPHSVGSCDRYTRTKTWNDCLTGSNTCSGGYK